MKSDVAREYRKKHPDYPSHKLARIIYEENKLLFKDVESVRSTLRYIEGKQGKANRKKVIKSEFYMKEDRPKNPYSLPPSDEASYEPYIIHNATKVALLHDIHVPYHSISALTTVFDRLIVEKPEVIVLNGDTLDFHGLSRFVKDPKKRSVAEELEACVELINSMFKYFGAKIIFKYGNHDERYEHFIWQKAKELVGVKETELDYILNSRINNPLFEIVKDKRIIQLNGLNIIHGHEFGMSVFSPVNIARGLYLKGKVSAIQGHNHAVSEHTEPDMNGNITTTWSAGCLCELNPAYLPINKWSHGFAMVDVEEDYYHVRNYRIRKGKLL